MTREEALERIAELARRHDLDISDVVPVLPSSKDRTASSPDWARRLLAVVGGLLVLAGLIGVLQLVWDDLAPFARVLTVFGSGLVLLVLGVVAGRDPAYESAASPLLLVAGLFQTTGLFVLLDEYSTGTDELLGAMLVFGVMTAQFGLLFAALKRTDLLFLLLLSATLVFGTTLAWLDVEGEWILLVIGVSGLLISYGLERTRWRGLCGLAWFAYAACTAIGLFGLVEGRFPFDLLLIVAAVLLVQLSIHVQSRPLLVAAVIVLLAYLGYFTGEYFADVLGWPIALIVFGLVLLALSGYAVRLGRGMRAEPPSRSEPR